MVIAIVTEGETEISKIADYIIEIPDTEEPLTPLLSVIPMQLLSLSYSSYAWMQCRSTEKSGKICNCRINFLFKFSNNKIH